MIRVPTNRPPTHPGEMLLEEFLTPMGLSQRELADAIHVPYQRVNEIINERRGITPSTARRLAKFIGMSADFWMNLQLRWDLYNAQQSERNALKKIRPRKYPRAGWDEQFRKMAKRGDDRLIDESTSTQWDAKNWKA